MSASAGTLEIHRGNRHAWLTIGVGLIAVSVAIGATLTFVGSDDSRSTGRAVSVTRGGELSHTEQLVNSGVVPREALLPQLSQIEQLVNAGLVPSQTLQPLVEPLYSVKDLATIAAVEHGLVPAETLDRDHFLILRFINHGLIPREAANA